MFDGKDARVGRVNAVADAMAMAEGKDFKENQDGMVEQIETATEKKDE